MIKKTNSILFLTAFALSLLFASCGGNGNQSIPEPSEETTLQLMNWLDQNGQFINSEAIPSLVDAKNVFPLLNNNILLIDIREQEAFDNGHIEGAIHKNPGEVLPYLINDIDPASFEQVILVCENSMISGHINGLARLMGFSNVVSLRFGMSGWNPQTAKGYWLSATSNMLLGKLESKVNPKAAPGSFPKLASQHKEAFDILKERCLLVGSEHPSAYTITIEQIMQAPEKYYIIAYWPEDKYIEYGHIPGSIQYAPKKSLVKDAQLNTLPTDKPVVVYCYSGQHSSFVVPYLRVLGYDALNLVYGANSFIHETLRLNEDRPARTFTDKLIMDYPLVKTGEKPAEKPAVPVEKTETKAVAGGC